MYKVLSTSTFFLVFALRSVEHDNVRISNGRLFHMVADGTANALSSSRQQFTSSFMVSAELRAVDWARPTKGRSKYDESQLA